LFFQAKDLFVAAVDGKSPSHCWLGPVSRAGLMSRYSALPLCVTGRAEPFFCRSYGVPSSRVHFLDKARSHLWGLVHLRERFVQRCHGGWQRSLRRRLITDEPIASLQSGKSSRHHSLMQMSSCSGVSSRAWSSRNRCRAGYSTADRHTPSSWLRTATKCG